MHYTNDNVSSQSASEKMMLNFFSELEVDKITTETTSTFIEGRTSLDSEPDVSEEELIVPSYKDMQSLVVEYFKMFFVENKKYTPKIMSSYQINSTGSNDIIGYFSEDNLVWFEAIVYGDFKTSYTQFYFVSTDLIYVKKCISSSHPGNLYEVYNDYYIINGNVFQYSDSSQSLELAEDSSIYDFFNLIKCELFKDETIQSIKYSSNKLDGDSIFLDTSQDIRTFFTNNLFNGKKFSKETQKVNCTEQNSDDIIGIFDSEQALKLSVYNSDDLYAAEYNYYLIDESLVYIVIRNQKFKNESRDNRELLENYYEEYILIDGKVMKYDFYKQGLIESPDNELILTNFNIAKDSIEAR